MMKKGTIQEQITYFHRSADISSLPRKIKYHPKWQESKVHRWTVVQADRAYIDQMCWEQESKIMMSKSFGPAQTCLFSLIFAVCRFPALMQLNYLNERHNVFVMSVHKLWTIVSTGFF